MKSAAREGDSEGRGRTPSAPGAAAALGDETCSVGTCSVMTHTVGEPYDSVRVPLGRSMVTMERTL
ncbi:hypothetical protein GCM10009679_64830 [Saccharothrix algeriensis]